MKNNDLEFVKHSLQKQNSIIGSKIYYYENLSSTMITAKQIASEGSPEGSIILAGAQDNSRGRLGKSWFSPKGGLWMTVILRPSVSPEETSLLTLAAGVSVCKTINNMYLIKSGLKWPNDVMVNNKKVCGVLTEGYIDSNTIKFVILGIGVNLNFSNELLPEGLNHYASTLIHETGRYIDSTSFLFNLLENLNIAYKDFKNDKTKIIQSWKNLSVTIGKEVLATGENSTIEGTAKDIAPDGSLIIETNNGELIEVRSGEVSLRNNPHSIFLPSLGETNRIP